MISVVVPTLNAAGTLGATLACLGAARAGGLISEIIVADGGSEDATLEVALAAGARVHTCESGRGQQLAEGAAAASGEWLLFVHADTVLEGDWAAEARAFVDEAGNKMRAAVFRFALDDAGAAARRLEWIVAWRTRVLGLPYGDQGLLIPRALYDQTGGFQPLPLMEDVDLVRRIGRARIEMLGAAAVTSAARYRRSGYLARSARNLACLSLYFMGVPVRTIARFYG